MLKIKILKNCIFIKSSRPLEILYIVSSKYTWFGIPETLIKYFIASLKTNYFRGKCSSPNTDD